MKLKQLRQRNYEAGEELKEALELTGQRKYEEALPHAVRVIRLVDGELMARGGESAAAMLAFALLAKAECLLHGKRPNKKDGLEALKTARAIAAKVQAAAEVSDATKCELEILLRLRWPWQEVRPLADEAWQRLHALNPRAAYETLNFYTENVFWTVPINEELQAREDWCFATMGGRAEAQFKTRETAKKFPTR